jgi:hypothetical protein
MADRVKENVWGPLAEAVELAGERAKELNGHARDLARAAVTEIRERAVSIAAERTKPVLERVRSTARDAQEALVERVGGLELGSVAEQVGKRIEDVRKRVVPFEGVLRGRVEALLKGFNLALHSDVADLEKRLAEADKRLARLERQVAEVRRAA